MGGRPYLSWIADRALPLTLVRHPRSYLEMVHKAVIAIVAMQLEVFEVDEVAKIVLHGNGHSRGGTTALGYARALTAYTARGLL